MKSGWSLTGYALAPLAVAVLLMVPVAAADMGDTEEVEELVRYDQVKGQVVYLKRGIGMMSIEVSSTEDVILLINDDVVVHYAEDLSDIHRGDVVRVQFAETYTEDAGEIRSYSKRTVTEISLVRRATKGLRSGE